MRLVRFDKNDFRYPTHFGQMECLKLIASPKFHEKRVCKSCMFLDMQILGRVFGFDATVGREHGDSDACDQLDQERH